MKQILVLTLVSLTSIYSWASADDCHTDTGTIVHMVSNFDGTYQANVTIASSETPMTFDRVPARPHRIGASREYLQMGEFDLRIMTNDKGTVSIPSLGINQEPIDCQQPEQP